MPSGWSKMLYFWSKRLYFLEKIKIFVKLTMIFATSLLFVFVLIEFVGICNLFGFVVLVYGDIFTYLYLLIRKNIIKKP